jgi:hypothetical protein
VRTAAWVPLVLCLSVVVAACSDAGGPGQSSVVAPEPLTPRGPTEVPFVFSWRPASAETPIYRVRVTDAAERVLYEQDVRNTECRPTTELKNMMSDHATFTWTVSVLSADGTREVAHSAPVDFKLR